MKMSNTQEYDEEPEENKGCPLLTAGQYAAGSPYRWEQCRGDECQLWWLCKGADRPKKEAK